MNTKVVCSSNRCIPILYQQVVVFDNKGSSVNYSNANTRDVNLDDNESGSAFLLRILQYLETPQYLRKSLFPMHSSLRVVVRISYKIYWRRPVVFVLSCSLLVPENP